LTPLVLGGGMIHSIVQAKAKEVLQDARNFYTVSDQATEVQPRLKKDQPCVLCF
jgi:hypothetical protein